MSMNKQGREKANRLFNNINDKIEGKDVPDISLKDIQWLALGLIELDNNLRKVEKELKSSQELVEIMNQAMGQ